MQQAFRRVPVPSIKLPPGGGSTLVKEPKTKEGGGMQRFLASRPRWC